MPSLQQPLLVITDLDGSLLDHHTYRWDAAAEWLAELQRNQVPVVICSSKTAAEIVPLQKRIGLTGIPFIAENGALVQMSAQRRVRVPPESPGYDALCQTLSTLQSRFRFQGFCNFSNAEVAAMTGLAEGEATLARQREASEVIVWRDDEEKLEAFRAALAQHQLQLTQGGRFWHVMPTGSGKGEALRWLLGQYDHVPTTIGLGDGPNDAPMLDAVDYAVVIKGYSKKSVSLTRQDAQQIYHTAHYGPEGWKEGLDYFLSQPD